MHRPSLRETADGTLLDVVEFARIPRVKLEFWRIPLRYIQFSRSPHSLQDPSARDDGPKLQAKRDFCRLISFH